MRPSAWAAIAFGGISLTTACIAAGTWTPVAYGASAASTPVITTGVVSTILSLLSGSGALGAFLKSLAPLASSVTKTDLDDGAAIVTALLGKADSRLTALQASLAFAQHELMVLGDTENSVAVQRVFEAVRNAKK